MGYAESRDSFSTLVQQAVAAGPGHNSLAPAADPVAVVSTRLRILAASSLEHFVSAQLVAFFPWAGRMLRSFAVSLGTALSCKRISISLVWQARATSVRTGAGLG